MIVSSWRRSPDQAVPRTTGTALLQAITGNRHVLGYVAVIDTERTVRSFGSVVFEPFFESHVLVLLERARPELVEVWDARSSQLLEDVHLLLIESFDHVPQRRRKPVAVHVERPFLILDKRYRCQEKLS